VNLTDILEAPPVVPEAASARPRVGFVSLGCPKNLVDSEVMMGLLDRAGAELTSDPETAEILVVNTCSFIDSAKQESVDTILEMAQHKTAGRARKLIVAGCLVERYRDEIRKNIPEVDAVVGTGELESILSAAGFAPSIPAASPLVNITLTSPAIPRHAPADAAASRAEGDLREQQGRFARDGQDLRVPQDRRGLRPPLLVLCDPEPAREVPFPPLRVGRRRS
jgi:ribosomal protein S12 methylthiotransferase